MLNLAPANFLFFVDGFGVFCMFFCVWFVVVVVSISMIDNSTYMKVCCSC